VALVTDVHVGAIWGAARVRRIVTLLQRLQPRAVFVSGDLFDGPKIDIAAAVAPWAACRVPTGTYFVAGNHDEFRDPAPYLAALTAVGVRVLNNEKVIIDDLQLIGIHDSHTHHPAAYQDVLTRARINPASPSILLSHRPALLEIPEAAGVSLQLAGHTHNGQFPIWTWIVRALYGRYAYGAHRVGGLQLVTSSGASTGGPPFRVGTRSEIVLIRLERGTDEAVKQ
ncbi:MAG TPA: metallophosphoesterase, partial [Candidatus Synoicihabitans sp.]|nr:metallophosphoesterase [Candidatus Synoicihabitans sp.]